MEGTTQGLLARVRVGVCIADGHRITGGNYNLALLQETPSGAWHCTRAQNACVCRDQARLGEGISVHNLRQRGQVTDGGQRSSR